MRRYGGLSIGMAEISEQQPQGTNGGTNIAGNNARVLNNIESNNIGAKLTTVGAYLGKGVDLPINNYYFMVDAPAGAGVGVHKVGIGIYDQLDHLLQPIEWCGGNSAPAVGQDIGHCGFYYPAIIPIRVVIWHYTATSVLNTGLGVPVNQAGVNEHYSELTVMALGANTMNLPAQDTFGSNANGYWEKDGLTGIIRQYGKTIPLVASGVPTNIILPIPFPNIFQWASSGMADTPTVGGFGAGATSVIINNSTIGIYHSIGGTQAQWWEAIGN